jgi:hypothetical protein
MMTYIFTINFIASTYPKVFAHVMPAMEWTQGLIGTFEAKFDWQAFPVRRVLTIVELLNVVHSDNISKFNHIVSLYA